jgi:hypothetical protein
MTAYKNYLKECEDKGLPKLIHLRNWMDWVTYSATAQRLIMSPHRWGWWQSYNAARGSPLDECLAKSLFDMCEAEDQPALLPTERVLSAFVMVLPHLQPLV